MVFKKVTLMAANLISDFALHVARVFVTTGNERSVTVSEETVYIRL